MSIQPIQLTLPYPPSVNRYWRSVKGRVLISEAGRGYRESVRKVVGMPASKANCPMAVTVEAWMPDRRRRDIDNLCKAILDSLTHADVWEDDNLVDDLRIVRMGVDAPGKVVVTIRRIEK